MVVFFQMNTVFLMAQKDERFHSDWISFWISYLIRSNKVGITDFFRDMIYMSLVERLLFLDIWNFGDFVVMHDLFCMPKNEQNQRGEGLHFHVLLYVCPGMHQYCNFFRQKHKSPAYFFRIELVENMWWNDFTYWL